MWVYQDGHSDDLEVAQIWNDISPKVFDKCVLTKKGLLIPGSAKNSDLAASTGIIKKRLKDHLLSQQKSGNPLTW